MPAPHHFSDGFDVDRQYRPADLSTRTLEGD